MYRPGQTVYIGGLCWDRKNDREQAAGERKVVLALRDPNGKTVAEQTVESDEWGTFFCHICLTGERAFGALCRAYGEQQRRLYGGGIQTTDL